MIITVNSVRQMQVTIAHYPTYSMFRNPGYDDQTVFWKVIRQNKDPRIHPIGTCRNLDPVPSNSTYPDQDPPLTTCFLDICMFNSGMLRDFDPEFKYCKSDLI